MQKRALAQFPDEETRETLVRPFEMYLSRKSTEEFIAELRAIVAKYRKRSNTEVALENFENIEPVSGLLVMGPLNGWGNVMLRHKQKK